MQKKLLLTLSTLVIACAQIPEQDSSIIFHSTRDEIAFNIYELDPETGEIVTITQDTTWSYHPVWSGQDKILYIKTIGEVQVARYERNLLTGDEMPHLPGFHPEVIMRVSPNGKHLAYHLEVGETTQIFVANSDGTSETQLTNDIEGNTQVRWAPDSKQLVFRSSRDGNPELYTMHRDGSNQTRITFSDSLDRYAQWSPKGDKIAFASTRDSKELEIYVMDVDGSNVTRLTNNDAEEGELGWSPDGSQIVYKYYDRETEKNHDIYIMNLDGTNKRRLTEHSRYDGYPSWGLRSKSNDQ